MTDNNLTYCEKCKGELEYVERYVSMETYRCKSCDCLYHFHVSDSLSDIEEFAKTLKRVFISWRMKPDAKQLMKLKKLLPQFKNESLLTLMAKVEEEEKWELGNYSKSSALELCRKIDEIGIQKAHFIN